MQSGKQKFEIPQDHRVSYGKNEVTIEKFLQGLLGTSRDRNQLIVIVRCLNHLEPPASLAFWSFWFGRSTAPSLGQVDQCLRLMSVKYPCSLLKPGFPMFSMVFPSFKKWPFFIHLPTTKATFQVPTTKAWKHPSSSKSTSKNSLAGTVDVGCILIRKERSTLRPPVQSKQTKLSMSLYLWSISSSLLHLAFKPFCQEKYGAWWKSKLHDIYTIYIYIYKNCRSRWKFLDI